ncbi:MAG: hypothetical protein K0R13_1783 [Propionibacteriaceae bacterium]|jgi:hypothetical protein|nr:hypothetical protein [Propionibacteriaceae bacterium]
MVATHASLEPKCNAQLNRLAGQTHATLERPSGMPFGSSGLGVVHASALACLPCLSGYFLPFAVVSSMLSSASTGARLTRIGSAAFWPAASGCTHWPCWHSLWRLVWVFLLATVVLAAASGAEDEPA